MSDLSISTTEVQSQRFVARVFQWMALGLVVTGAVAMMTASNPALLRIIVQNRWVFYGLMIAELGLVIALSRALSGLSFAAASGLFLTYAALNGLTFSIFFLAYTASSIATTFFVTAGMFGSMGVIGYTTEMDLTGMGALCSMGVIGLILAMIANMFLHNTLLESVTTYLGIAIFVGLTAYDAQKIKQMGAAYEDSDTGGQAIYGALRLYLDFINIFLFVLRLMGRRRN